MKNTSRCSQRCLELRLCSSMNASIREQGTSGAESCSNIWVHSWTQPQLLPSAFFFFDCLTLLNAPSWELMHNTRIHTVAPCPWSGLRIIHVMIRRLCVLNRLLPGSDTPLRGWWMDPSGSSPADTFTFSWGWCAGRGLKVWLHHVAVTRRLCFPHRLSSNEHYANHSPNESRTPGPIHPRINSVV